MAEVKTIKGIDEETWAEFRNIAAHHRLKTGKMFKVLVEEYKKQSTGFWEKIFSYKSNLTKEDQAQLSQDIKLLRKEHGWRI